MESEIEAENTYKYNITETPVRGCAIGTRVSGKSLADHEEVDPSFNIYIYIHLRRYAR